MTIGEAAAIEIAAVLLHIGLGARVTAVSSGRKITEAKALRAAPTWFCAASGRLGARPAVRIERRRWVYDSGALGAIRRDLMTILTHRA